MAELKTPKQIYDLVQSGWHGNLSEYPISEHFTWGEVFTNCSRSDIQQCARSNFDNALKQAQLMEEIRAFLKVPIIVHCWYRSESHNERVGGAPHSYHKKALATDWHALGYESAARNLEIQKRLDNAPFMQKAGLEFTGGTWTHSDSRGVKARFFG